MRCKNVYRQWAGSNSRKHHRVIMDAAVAFELEDRKKPLRYVLDSQKCSNMGGGGLAQGQG